MSAIVFGALGSGFHYMARARAEPEVISDSRVLYPDGIRGSGGAIGVSVPARASVLLTFSAFEDPNAYQDYRVDLLDLSQTPARPLWSRSGILVNGDGLFQITIPNEYLHEGVYQLQLFGVTGSSSARIASYTIHASSK